MTPGTPATLRLWPGVVAVGLQWVLRFGVPLVVPSAAGIGVISGLVLGLAVVVWWAFGSRLPRRERVAGIVMMAAALAVTPPFLHASLAKGMMGMLFFVYVVPVLSLALVGWAALSRRLTGPARLAALAAVILLACGSFTLFRTDGIRGDSGSDFAWRWTPTAEERLLAQAGAEVVPVPPPVEPLPAPDVSPAPVADTPPLPATASPVATPAPVRRNAAWPGFRGPQRDGVVRGARIATDWSARPPVEMWRRPVGPGWSSFAVDGDRLYTQEQRGEDEMVACYDKATGRPVWQHRDAARFWESNAGAGPRATPALGHGRVYTLGATGIVNALDAATGAVAWSRNAASDTGAKTPGWGFAGSPLVVGDTVVIATSGRLVAYDAATGTPRWFGPRDGGGYSSPHLVTLGGVPQVLLLNGKGATSVAPRDGKVLWSHAWPGDGIVQPALTADGDVLLGTGSGMGTGAGIIRLAVAHGGAGWTAVERWTSSGLKPYYNDFVVHEGHAYGFDGSILASIDLATGERRWKGGRYGHGQMILLPDQDLLVVLSEEGDLALVSATPDGFTEVARFTAIEGKTWNHPVLAGDVLLARNDTEMVAYRLRGADR